MSGIKTGDLPSLFNGDYQPTPNNYPGHQPNIESILQPSMRDGIIKGRPFFILADEIKDRTAYYTGAVCMKLFQKTDLESYLPKLLGISNKEELIQTLKTSLI